MKEGEDHDEDKKIVYRERLFDQIPCQKFESLLLSKLQVDTCIEEERECHPGGCPCRGFPEADFMAFTVENAKIHNKHGDEDEGKSSP